MKKTTLLIIALFSFSILFSQANWKWTQQESGVTTALRDVFFADNMTGWVVGDNGTILKTSDGGENWTAQLSGTDQELSAVHFIDVNTGWATGGGLTAKPAPLLKTTDGGATWESLSYEFNAFTIADVFFADASNGWLIRSDSIYHSIDGGMSWKHEMFVSNVSGPLFNKEIFATSDTVAFIAGRSDNGVSKPPGTVFDRRPYNAPNYWGTDGANQFADTDELQSITFATDEVGFSGGRQGVLYRMIITSPGINNGPWDKNLDLERSATIRSISFPTADVGMFNVSTQVGDVTIALVYHTEDQGETWTAVPDSVPDMLSARLFAGDKDHAWIVAIGGKIYKGEPDYSAIGENSFEMDLSVYPNPTTGNIHVNSSDQNGNLTITLINAQGQILSEQHLSKSGSMEIELIGNPGVYFVKAVSDKGGQRVIKVIKE